MVENIIFEIAVFVFLMLAIGIGLTVYEFKNFVIKKKTKSVRKHRNEDGKN